MLLMPADSVFTPIIAPSLKDLFVQQIIDKILSGDLAIGEKLPPNRILAEQMGISRTVVGNGITELVCMGFLDIQPRIGTYVADYRRKGGVETLAAIMKYRGNSLNESESRSYIALRKVLAAEAFRIVVAEADDASLAEIARCNEEVQHAETKDALIEAVWEFYACISILSKNTIVALIFNSFKFYQVAFWQRLYAVKGAEHFTAGVQGLCDLVMARDFESVSAYLETQSDFDEDFICR